MSLDYNIKSDKGLEQHHHDIQTVPKSQQKQSTITSIYNKVFSFLKKPDKKPLEQAQKEPPKAPIHKFGKSSDDTAPRLPIEPSNINIKKPPGQESEKEIQSPSSKIAPFYQESPQWKRTNEPLENPSPKVGAYLPWGEGAGSLKDDEDFYNLKNKIEPLTPSPKGSDLVEVSIKDDDWRKTVDEILNDDDDLPRPVNKITRLYPETIEQRITGDLDDLGIAPLRRFTFEANRNEEIDPDIGRVFKNNVWDTPKSRVGEPLSIRTETPQDIEISIPTIPFAESTTEAEVKSSPVELRIADPKRGYEAFVKKFNDGDFGSEPPTIHDARAFLEYVTLSDLFDSAEKVPRYLKDAVRQYFINTKQLAEYEELEHEIRRDICHEISDERQPALKQAARPRSYKELAESVETHLYYKLEDQPLSPTASPRALINGDDVRLLRAFKPEGFHKSQFDSLVEDVSKEFKKLEGLLKEADGRGLELFEKALKAAEEQRLNLPNATKLTDEEIKLILRAKQALLDLQTGIGRRCTLGALEVLCPGDLDAAFLDLQVLDNVRGPQIDAAMLAELTAEHDRAKMHPRVGIEGAGPTGLLLGMTQFQAGADVAIFEARSGMYERTQVVRLDPIWMRMLKHYLGEKYHALFTDKDRLGILRPDGFGEIPTLDLENALHARLTELMSMQKDPQSIVRVAAHEVTDVMSPKAAGGKFRVVAKYNRAYDISARYKQAVETLKFNGFYPHVKPEILNGVLTLTGMIPAELQGRLDSVIKAFRYHQEPSSEAL